LNQLSVAETRELPKGGLLRRAGSISSLTVREGSNHQARKHENMNTVPLAYLITIRCYGTWLHGDARGSMDRKDHHQYRGPKIEPNKKMSEAEEAEFKQAPLALTASQRAVVERAISEVGDHRGYQLLAVNARTSHVHSVVAAGCSPEAVMNALKAYATRRLRGAGLVANGVRPWSRHGSNPYLWTSEQVARAIDYVLHGQDDKPFDRDAPHRPTG
jgi:REP element-mobilizing transposase RayT